MQIIGRHERVIVCELYSIRGIEGKSPALSSDAPVQELSEGGAYLEQSALAVLVLVVL